MTLVELPLEHTLLARCRERDTVALGALFDLHHQAVHRYLARLVGRDHPDLEDLTQSTFVEAFRGSARFRAGSAVRTWLLGIATNLVRRRHRDQSRFGRVLQALGFLSPDPPESPERAAQRAQVLTGIAAAVLELPLELREVLVLCDAEGARGVEAARALGVPEGTVWRRLHEARKRVRARLEEP